MLGYDLYKEGKMNVIIVKNLSSTARVFSEIKLFNASEIYDFEWGAMGLSEVWKTKKINGYVSDMQIRDLDNDKKNKLVLSLVISSNMSILPKSVIVSYSLDLKKPENREEEN